MIAAFLVLLLAGQVPESVSWILHTNSGDDHCHGTPVGLTQILTAAHCVGAGEVEFVGQGLTGRARLMWRDDKRDLAMLNTSEPQAWHVVSISKRKPGDAAQGWARAFLPRLRSVAVPLTILGLDDDGDYDLVGYGPPGTSGSGLLNDSGELVGVVKMVFNPYAVGLRPKNFDDLINILQTAVKFVPAVAATPITEWPKP